MKTPLLSHSSSRWALAAALVTAYFGSSAVAWAQTEGTTTPPPPAGDTPAAPAAPTAPDTGAPAEGPGTGQVAAPPVKDAPAEETPKKEEKPKPNPFRGSILIFDQSMTTQTAHLETSPQQSYVPFYQWWVSFRPRYYITDRLNVGVRFDYYKEFTNSQDTTYYREDVFGDTWLTLGYSVPLPKEGALKNTRLNVGLRALLPTSKASQANGVYVNPGLTAGISQNVPLKKDDSAPLSSVHFAANFIYSHPLYKDSTANPSNLYIERQDVSGKSVISNTLNGSSLTSNSLISFFDAGLQVLPKLSVSANFALINAWKYQPKDDVTVSYNPNASPVAVPRNSDAPRMTEALWFGGSVDYELLDEITLSLGYYNFANALGPDAQHRGLWGTNNIWWSPDARVYFDVTANLDKILDWATGKGTVHPTTDPATRRQRLTQNSRDLKMRHIAEGNQVQGQTSY